MMEIFSSTSWIFASTLIVIPIVLVSLATLWIFRKYVSAETLRKHHDVTGFTFSIIGVLYSVILGFTVINVQDRHNQADETVRIEATMITDLYRDAAYFDSPIQMEIRSSLRHYVNYVVNEEWAHPQNLERRLNADAILQQIWKSYESIDLELDITKIWYQQTITKLDRLMDARLSREFYFRDHLSSMMWAVLLSGAVVTVCFMFFFGLDNLPMQMLMTGLLVGYLAFMLYLVYSLDHVFKGANHITPKAFEDTLVIFDRLDQLT